MAILARLRQAVNILGRLSVVEFFIGFFPYTIMRARQISVFSFAALDIFLRQFGQIKNQTVRRMFWGRGTLYKSSFHILTLSLTAIVLLASLVSRFAVSSTREQSLNVAYGISTNSDLLQQGASLSTVFALDETQLNYRVSKYTVASGDSLQSIADKYSVSKDTIRWANDKLISPFNDNISVGWEILIPEIDGVLYQVKSTDTLDSIVNLTAGNRFDIIELNALVPPGYSIAGKERIFVPNGRIVPPPPPPPTPVYARNPGGGGTVNNGVVASGALGSMPAGSFSNPLSHSSCSGYTYSRGYQAWHDGVDLAKGGGCPIRAIAAGTVIYAGWKAWGSGYTVIIDHGANIESQYLHGDGNIWVKVGQYVQKDQDIMFMGSTGNSTGVHLHLTLKHDGRTVDPRPYVPY